LCCATQGTDPSAGAPPQGPTGAMEPVNVPPCLRDPSHTRCSLRPWGPTSTKDETMPSLLSALRDPPRHPVSHLEPWPTGHVRLGPPIDPLPCLALPADGRPCHQNKQGGRASTLLQPVDFARHARHDEKGRSLRCAFTPSGQPWPPSRCWRGSRGGRLAVSTVVDRQDSHMS